jgi:hypothetical protein
MRHLTDVFEQGEIENLTKIAEIMSLTFGKIVLSKIARTSLIDFVSVAEAKLYI